MNNNPFVGFSPTWCPGCGDFGIFVGLQKALKEMGRDPSSVFFVFGIGCAGNMADFLNAYSMHGLHGRGIPSAIGMKFANHNMPVVMIAGDGDTYGEGGNHFLHACRGNHDITVIIHDNGLYGLTTGQASPRSLTGFKSKSTPHGMLERPLNPLALAISQGASFVAQAYSMDPNAYQIIKKGIEHKGFSLINMLQPCATFNKVQTPLYFKEHNYNLEEGYDVTNMRLALQRAMEPVEEEKFPLGILYQVSKPAFHEQLPQLGKSVLFKRDRFMGALEMVGEFI